ncbi:MAG: DedA family protein [archaeon]
MLYLTSLIDLILHIDKYLAQIIQSFGPFTYLFIFLIIAIETGIIIMPFLPGDSLFFVAGTFAAQGTLNIVYLAITLFTAAIVGDTINYFIGKFFGEKVFIKSRLFKEKYLIQTKEFYAEYGPKTIVLARFVPIIRTFAPFVAGVGEMKFAKFMTYNILGGFLWVILFVFAGYFFGHLEFVKQNLTWIIYLIIIVSATPMLIEYIKHKRKKKNKIKRKKTRNKIKRRN